MVPGEVSGLKNREPVIAGVLGGDYNVLACRPEQPVTNNNKV